MSINSISPDSKNISGDVNSINDKASRSEFLNQANKAAQIAKSNSQIDTVSESSVYNTAGITNINSDTKTAEINKALSDRHEIPQKHVFSNQQVELFDKDIMTMVKERVEIDSAIYLALGSMELLSGFMASVQNEIAAKYTENLRKFIGPLANLVKSEYDKQAEMTRKQAKMSMVEGITSVVAGTLELLGGIGGLTGGHGEKTKKTKADIEETSSTKEANTKTKLEEEHIKQTKKQQESKEKAELEEVDDINESKIKDKDKKSEEAKRSHEHFEKQLDEEIEGSSKPSKEEQAEVDSILNNKSMSKTERAKAYAKSVGNFFMKGVTGFKMVSQVFGANNAAIGQALSRITSGVGKIIVSTIQSDVALLQDEEGDIKAMEKRLQMEHDAAQQSLSRIQSAARTYEEFRNSLSQASRDYTQSRQQAARSMFG